MTWTGWSKIGETTAATRPAPSTRTRWPRPNSSRESGVAARHDKSLVLTSRRPAPWRIYLALVVAALLWGSLYPAAKPAVAATGAMQVTLCRVVLACVAMGALVLARNGPAFLVQQFRAHWRAVIVLGLLNFSASQILAMFALGLLPASVNGLLNNTHPLWIAVGSAIFFPPRRPVLLALGSAVALIGVGVVFLPDLVFGSQLDAPGLSGVGVALSLAGSGVIALGTAVGRRVVLNTDPLAILTLASGVAILPMSLLTMENGGFGPILSASGEVKLMLLYVGIGCTALNFGLWYFGLKHLSAAAASAFQYLIPPSSVVIAAIFLHEPLTAAVVVGTALILLGLAATQIASSPGSRLPPYQPDFDAVHHAVKTQCE